MQTAIFPMKVARVSASYNSNSIHRKNSQGKPADYPTDIVGKDTGRDWLYAPCDMYVLRRYTKASHAIWLRSCDKVQTPYGTGYLYIMCEHQTNAEMAAVGHKYKKGEKMFREAASGNASGNHIHISCGFSQTKKTAKNMGTGWRKNSKGAWIMSIPAVKNIKIEQAFFLDKEFTTTIKDIKGIKFKGDTI